MHSWERLYKGISRAAWGYLFLYFNINLETVDILPGFVGFLLFLSSIRCLEEQQQDMKLLRPLVILLAVWNGIAWCYSCVGETLTGKLLWMDILTDLAELYFHFQFLTNLASVAEKVQPSEGDFDKKLLKCRTMQTVLVTAIMVLSRLSSWLGEAFAYLSVSMMLVSVIVSVCIVVVLFRLRRTAVEIPG